jgi:anaerobic ribonucleoside-triphosphate reductase activating protein
MLDDTVRLHSFEPGSRVNGPGLRAVVWVQGCALGCPGCFNPETHDFTAGRLVSADALADEILQLKDAVEGVTISGGEPAHQHRPLARMLKRVKAATGLSVLVFSGYTLEELHRIPGIEPFLSCIDVLIAGRYDKDRRVASQLIGSSNKTVHFFTERYSQHHLESIPQAEVLLSPDGQITISGIDPLRWYS